MLNNVSLQDSILQQLQIVNKDQIFPIWVSKFVHLKIFIGNTIYLILLFTFNYFSFIYIHFQMI